MSSESKSRQGEQMSHESRNGEDWLRSQDFYELCQRYRHARDIIPAGPGLPNASEAFEELQREILARFTVSERRDTPSEAAIDAALAFLHKSRYLSHPDVREWRGTANGDTEEAWNRDYVAALLRAALAANHDGAKP